MNQLDAPVHPPEVGQLVHVRSRTWLVDEVIPPAVPGQSCRVRLACADDDAQGQTLEVLWEYELDRQILQDATWADLATRGFDPPHRFAAFLHTLRWNCVTATDPTLFQAPFRAGIRIDAYQMEPLRKALRLPRVNLFIADDTGLGKTIEAGLIIRELLLRKKVRTIVVAAPPSVLEQWQAELEERFGLTFVLLDRAYLARMRRERGFGVNPWRTHSRFLVSHRLLVDPTYADPLREWLGAFLPGSMFVLDEAHHAAPASGNRYGIESDFTRAIRDLAWRFEHRLFLSATPHNGHSNSFATLLELLDPIRFTRGVRVRGRKALEQVMTRRLKEDIRAVQGGFPRREVIRIELNDLPADAPELTLSRLLDEYRALREQRFADAPRRVQTAAALLTVGLQQRLLSSIEAFARSLKVHRATVERQWARDAADVAAAEEAARRFTSAPDADDERGLLDDQESEAAEQAEVEALTAAAEAAAPPSAAAAELRRREQALLDEMQRIAEAHRYRPDAKTRYLIDWIRANLCPGLPPFGQPVTGPPPRWTNRRVLIFTENREGTKRYLMTMLAQAIEGSDRADERIEVIDGLTSSARRQEIQRRFNTDPAHDPLRILLATDAAREGLNFQAHCADLFHFDLPWNPGRIEQRNGRIDRKLQPEPVVRCHYFVLPQRAEDRVLEVLVRKTETIKRELGSLSKVIDDDIERLLRFGIRRRDVPDLVRALEQADLDAAQRQSVAEDLEQARERERELQAQIETCRSLLEKSQRWTGFTPEAFRQALDCALEMIGAPPLQRAVDALGREVWHVPALNERAAADPTWNAILDSLRAPRPAGQSLSDWRREAPIRPVVFADTGTLSDETVHLHLEHRVAQRLLARFRAQGFTADLARACVLRASDAIPRVLLLGRLSLFGQGAERLHEEIITVAARWIEPAQRSGPLTPYGRDGEARAKALLDEALRRAGQSAPDRVVQQRLLQTAAADIADLSPHLVARAGQAAAEAIEHLRRRGEQEAADLRAAIEDQQRRVREHLDRSRAEYRQLTLGFDREEERQFRRDQRVWEQRLDAFERDLATEPQRVRAFYEVRAQRVEPVGLVYLWPETN
ncbi:MAG: DISARM system SNF2-like helicase DrmD [Planctomycetota bacterium]|nr:DISARM system SNF2-like helicase DrmD [Planctomycetota bacterium]